MFDFSADGHIIEPEGLLTDGLPPSLRKLGIRAEKQGAYMVSLAGGKVTMKTPPNRPKLSIMPSQIIARQVSCSFPFDRACIMARSVTGAKAMMWGSDYPHHEGTFPKSKEVIAHLFDDIEISESDKADILGLNAAGCSASRTRPQLQRIRPPHDESGGGDRRFRRDALLLPRHLAAANGLRPDRQVHAHGGGGRRPRHAARRKSFGPMPGRREFIPTRSCRCRARTRTRRPSFACPS